MTLIQSQSIFQSTPSLRKVTFCLYPIQQISHNFNPHLPYGRWQEAVIQWSHYHIFQSTPSLRKVTLYLRVLFHFVDISIHTFLAEGDVEVVNQKRGYINFNPHLPCGRWPPGRRLHLILRHFNPHLPCGRWLLGRPIPQAHSHFNPHLPCGRWRYVLRKVVWSDYFNPHLPCGRWQSVSDNLLIKSEFQSTPSLRKVTAKISIIIFL